MNSKKNVIFFIFDATKLMEYLNSLFSIIDSIFRPLIVLVSACFAVFFYSRKVGNSVKVKFEVVSNRLSATRINNIILINKKDKPVCIYSIYAIFDKEILLNLHQCKPPLILKPYETISIETEPYSSLYIGPHKYTPDYLESEIYIESADGMIRCKSEIKKGLGGSYRRIMKNTMSFNDVVHAEDFKYILVYKINNELKTSFIHATGYITHDWDFGFTVIKTNMQREINYQDIVSFLELNGFTEIFKSYNIYEIDFHGHELVYSSTHQIKVVQET